MIVKNLKVIQNIPFEEYLALPGWSHSTIKNEGVPFKGPTHKMQLGTDVHNYLLTPVEYNHHNRDLVIPIARELRRQIGGSLIDKMKPELVVTADFVYGGFVLAFKGRLDLSIIGRLVVDLKVSDMPLSMGIARFGYDSQQSGYSLAIGAKIALMVRISPTSVKKGKPLTETYNVPISEVWWDDQILKRGEPML